MSADLTPIAGKLSCLVRLLACDKDGEVVAAARAIREQDNSVAAQAVYRDPTKKQAMWLKSIFLRLGGKLS